MRTNFVVSSALLLYLLPYSALTQVKKQMYNIVDVHLHAFSAQILNHPIANPMNGVMPPATMEENDELCFKHLKGNNIYLAITSGTLSDVKRWTTHDSTHIWGAFAVTQPGKDANHKPINYDSLELAIQHREIRMIGEVANQYSGFAINDSGYDTLFVLAEKYHLPVAVHTGTSFEGTPFMGSPKFRLKFGNPLLLEDVLIKHPSLKINMMHLGLPWKEETIAMLSMYPNLYTDLGVVDWVTESTKIQLSDFLKELKKLGLLHKVMFGTDQMRWPDAIPLAVNFIANASFLTSQEKQDIFFNNAVKFLNIEREDIKVFSKGF